MAVGLEQVREYMEAAIGKLSPAKAQELAKSLTKSKSQGRDQVSKAAKDLLAWSNKNKERLTSMVQTEVKSQLKTIGVASRDEVDALRKRVRELERERRGHVGLVGELGHHRRELRRVADDGEAPDEADEEEEPERPVEGEADPERAGAGDRRPRRGASGRCDPDEAERGVALARAGGASGVARGGRSGRALRLHLVEQPGARAPGWPSSTAGRRIRPGSPCRRRTAALWRWWGRCW